MGLTRYDYLIIGGGVAGVTAAETIRENDLSATIAIISEEPHLFYSRVLLPAYLKKRIYREQLFLRHADDFTKKRIDLLLAEKVAHINFKRKEVSMESGAAFDYQKLLLASGGGVKPWNLNQSFDADEKPDQDLRQSFSTNAENPPDQNFLYRLQTLADADRLTKAIPFLQNPLVIGASFISLELLEIFIAHDISPVLLVRGHHFFEKILDRQGGELLYSNFSRHGIKTHFNDQVSDFKKNKGLIKITTKAFREIEVDSLAVGVGITPNVEFLQGYGLKIGNRGILVNEFLETNETGVFAAGDVAEFYDFYTGEYRTAGNWTNAFLQGKRAGLNMLGRYEPFKNVTSYSITNLGLQITALGKTDGSLETVVRMDEASNQYERFFLQKDVLVGAALINKFADKKYLVKLIESKTSLSAYREQLKDPGFDIHNIPAI